MMGIAAKDEGPCGLAGVLAARMAAIAEAPVRKVRRSILLMPCLARDHPPVDNVPDNR
jgi:hypothetical protein